MATAKKVADDVFEDGADFKVGPVSAVPEPELSEEESAAIVVTEKGPEEAFGEYNKIQLSGARQYSLAGRADPPKQRLARLQLEVNALLSEVEAASASLGGDKPDESKGAVEMVSQVKALATALQSVELDALAESWSGSAPAALQNKLSADLMTDLGSAKTAASAASKRGEKGDGSATITYEVYYNAEQSQLADATRASQLDERIAKLEKLVGSESLARASAMLKDDDADITIPTAITKLSEKLNAVSEEGTDTIRARLQAVLKLADEVGEKKSATDNAEADERAQRIEKLYNTAAGLDKFATAIPMLIERLTALKAIHEKGADFAKTVAHLDATQKQLEAMFANDKKMLEKLSTTFAENAAKIEANFKATEERIKSLESKLKK